MNLDFKKAYKRKTKEISIKHADEIYDFTIQNLDGKEWLRAKSFDGSDFYAALLSAGIVEPKLSTTKINEMIKYALPLADAIGKEIVQLKQDEEEALAVEIDNAEKN